MVCEIEEHLHILRCPITKKPLRLAEPWEIDQWNECISRGECSHYEGTPVIENLTDGIISVDGTFVYRVRGDMLCMLPAQAIRKGNHAPKRRSEVSMESRKEKVQEFYDEVGWKQIGEETFSDGSLFEDLREVSSRYISDCHLRILRYIKKSGKYMLDVASGPIQYKEYLAYSKEYDFRICVDISLLALQEAMKRIGSKGIFIQADITNLPLQDSSVDAVVSLHTIYHVPAEEQFVAFRELYRVAKPGVTAAAVYYWSDSPLVKIMSFASLVAQAAWSPLRVLRDWTSGLLGSPSTNTATDDAPHQTATLYFYAHPRERLQEELGKFCDFDIVVWRSVSVPFLKTYVRPWLLGRQILSLIYFLEEKLPHFFGKMGAYPIIVMYKR